MKITTKHTCPNCNGIGQIIDKSISYPYNCTHCNSAGFIEKEEEWIDTEIPNFPSQSIVPPMTLRQHYAGLAMQGLCAVPDKGTFKDSEEGWLTLAIHAASIADALIKELNKEPVK